MHWMKEIDSNNINDILSIMYPFILFKLHGQIEDTDPPPKQRYTITLQYTYSDNPDRAVSTHFDLVRII